MYTADYFRIFDKMKNYDFFQNFWKSTVKHFEIDVCVLFYLNHGRQKTNQMRSVYSAERNRSLFCTSRFIVKL